MFTLDNSLTTPEKLRNQLPFNVAERDNCVSSLKKTIEENGRFIVVCGPCSANDYSAVLEYCEKLAKINEKISKYILLVPRIFTVKPRSKGEGYLGMLFMQENNRVNINKGLYNCRKLLIECSEITHLPIADEFLFPEQYQYFSDIVSYYFIGARTSESALHRDYASGLDVPVGIKNNTGGDISALAQAVYCASMPKDVLMEGKQYSTSGNKFAHGVLRGYNKDGEYISNFEKDTISKYRSLLQERCCNFVLVDCSHANSKKDPLRQIDNAKSVVKDKLAGGIMLESYLYTGANGGYGYSVTDPCLGFDLTEKLLYDLCDELTK